MKFYSLILLLFTAPFLYSEQNTSLRGTIYDEEISPGQNYEIASFRLWIPKGIKQIRAIVVLVPGSNRDGRPKVEDTEWQAFANLHNLAILGCYYTDKKHEQMFIEEYVNVSQGSGQALERALESLAKRSNHTEVATAPLLLWGMSAGGQFNYEFVAWKPERVLGFVVNKGGIYYSALLSRAARSVPGLLFTGEYDMASRTETINGLFSLNRRGGALWALTQEPQTKHEVGRSKEMSLIFFEELLPLRLPSTTSSNEQHLQKISENSGFIGQLKNNIIKEQKENLPPTYPSSWLPSERAALAWKSVVTGAAFEQ